MAGFSAMRYLMFKVYHSFEADAEKKQCGFIQARGRLLSPTHGVEVIV